MPIAHCSVGCRVDVHDMASASCLAKPRSALGTHTRRCSSRTPRLFASAASWDGDRTFRLMRDEVRFYATFLSTQDSAKRVINLIPLEYQHTVANGPCHTVQLVWACESCGQAALSLRLLACKYSFHFDVASKIERRDNWICRTARAQDRRRSVHKG